MDSRIDISEEEIVSWGNGIMETLLMDRTTGRNIYWATEDYKSLGEGYGFFDEITIDKITGEHSHTIQPRVCKRQEVQKKRSKDMAEVFTPSWVCNAQNNLVDKAWFGTDEDIFNKEVSDADGLHSWAPITHKIEFPEGRTWHDYVTAQRMEITCGEAPYLCSRYDTTTAEFFEDVYHRIGLLDRKLRIVSENAKEEKKDRAAGWIRMATRAYQSTYGFEWQGDSLLLARESLLQTYIEFYRQRWGKDPKKSSLKKIAEIISWNVWQMDGLKHGLPGYELKEKIDVMLQVDILPQERYCRIMDWKDYKPLRGEEVIFHTLVNK